jgi:hypothetical protein
MAGRLVEHQKAVALALEGRVAPSSAPIRQSDQRWIPLLGQGCWPSPAPEITLCFWSTVRSGFHVTTHTSLRRACELIRIECHRHPPHHDIRKLESIILNAGLNPHSEKTASSAMRRKRSARRSPSQKWDGMWTAGPRRFSAN